MGEILGPGVGAPTKLSHVGCMLGLWRGEGRRSAGKGGAATNWQSAYQQRQQAEPHSPAAPPPAPRRAAPQVLQDAALAQCLSKPMVS